MSLTNCTLSPFVNFSVLFIENEGLLLIHLKLLLRTRYFSNSIEKDSLFWVCILSIECRHQMYTLNSREIGWTAGSDEKVNEQDEKEEEEEEMKEAKEDKRLKRWKWWIEGRAIGWLWGRKGCGGEDNCSPIWKERSWRREGASQWGKRGYGGRVDKDRNCQGGKIGCVGGWDSRPTVVEHRDCAIIVHVGFGFNCCAEIRQ